jgi:hypothetical protein
LAFDIPALNDPDIEKRDMDSRIKKDKGKANNPPHIALICAVRVCVSDKGAVNTIQITSY